ncbi:hypothetical protein OG871_01565 [Kitasatospora sp. NBC_00374]|uniref:hypothetical protein n=1 Tax=Kitasatospora sp. NBC_00374 TaxID=2975964 RepID=UPI0030E3186B
MTAPEVQAWSRETRPPQEPVTTLAAAGPAPGRRRRRTPKTAHDRPAEPLNG